VSAKNRERERPGDRLLATLPSIHHLKHGYPAATICAAASQVVEFRL
jgi:hypothetical protein